MDIHHGPSPRRRSDALERLRTMTAGVAVAGIAATAGFGFAAANGYRGTSSQGVTTAGGGTQGITTAPGTNQAPRVQPNPGNGFQAPSANGGVQAPSRGRGSSHVSSGGS